MGGHGDSRMNAEAALFRDAEPFPHVCLDDAVPADLIHSALAHWPEPIHPGWKQNQDRKRAFTLHAHPELAGLMLWGNRPQVVEWLRRLTGIADVTADPDLNGGGLHEVSRGGRLGIHVDFNVLKHLKRTPYRRLNMLLYLNERWEPEWNGALELRKDSQVPLLKYEPIFNRLVVFETSEFSWHGHPLPLACPEGITRRSVAWYYYSKTPHPSFTERHSTIYR